jgi:deoxyhypusine synthase
MHDMVEFGPVDVVATTGAIACDDLYEAHEHRHQSTDPETDGRMLREHFLDRVCEHLGGEDLFRNCDDKIATLPDGLEPRPYSSRDLLAHVGKIASKGPDSLVGARYR